MTLREFIAQATRIAIFDDYLKEFKTLDYELKITPRDDDGTEPVIGEIYTNHIERTITIEVN